MASRLPVWTLGRMPLRLNPLSRNILSRNILRNIMTIIPRRTPMMPLKHSKRYSLAQLKVEPIEVIKKKRSLRAVNEEFILTPDATCKAVAFSTAESYQFVKLLDLLVQKYSLMPYLSDDVHHVQLTNGHGDQQADAFLFNNGTIATWNASDAQNQELLSLVKSVEINPYSAVESDYYDYIVDPTQSGKVVAELIVLGDDMPLNQARLAYSAGMSHSVKLGSFETQLENLVEKTRNIHEFFLKGGKVPFTRDYILRNLGELFSLRAQVNLHSELLDSPDFCWSCVKMESVFNRISRSLDVRPRIAVFNKKLDYANEVAEVLRNFLHEQHSLKLEWAIIILIGVEILFSTVGYLEAHDII